MYITWCTFFTVWERKSSIVEWVISMFVHHSDLLGDSFIFLRCSWAGNVVKTWISYPTKPGFSLFGPEAHSYVSGFWHYVNFHQSSLCCCAVGILLGSLAKSVRLPAQPLNTDIYSSICPLFCHQSQLTFSVSQPDWRDKKEIGSVWFRTGLVISCYSYPC